MTLKSTTQINVNISIALLLSVAACAEAPKSSKGRMPSGTEIGNGDQVHTPGGNSSPEAGDVSYPPGTPQPSGPIIAGTPPSDGRGASVPWTEYEAEDGMTTGKIIGPTRVIGEVASEASGRKAVRLEATGQYVAIKTTKPANSIVVRYSIPDTADGVGQDATLGIYVDGKRVKSMTVTSKYAWVYGNESHPLNQPGDGPRRFFDESRLLLDNIPVGAEVKVQKDASDAALSYVIDLIDLEQVAAAAEKPANFLSIVDYGAKADDAADDFKAIQAALDDGAKQGKGVWIPPGTFRIETQTVAGKRDFIKNGGVELRGAGMWYSTLQGPGASLACMSNACKFSNFAVTGETKGRDDNYPDNGFDGGAGKGSRLENIWVERTKVGYWVGKHKGIKDLVTDGLVITGSRFRNLFADGVNFANGTKNSIVENTHIRYPGDDGLAMWSYSAEGDPADQNNIFRNVSVQLPWRANCFAFYGGTDNKLMNSSCTDTLTYPGVFVSGLFQPAHPFLGTTTISGINLIRNGGRFWNLDHGALKIDAEGGGNVENILVENVDISDSTASGIHFQGAGKFNNIKLKNIKVTNSGTQGIWATVEASNGKVSFENVVIEKSAKEALKNDSMMNAFIEKGPGNVGW